MKYPELLSPVGDFECLKSAVQNGANSVYLGAGNFNARARATNFDNSELIKAIKYAKLRNVAVHLTLNTLIKNEEFEDAVKLAVTAYNSGVDAIIIQDLGLAKYLLKNYPQIPLHASTQMTVHNLEGVRQLKKMGFERVVLSRELSIKEIEEIRKEVNDVELEVFIHGALCISYSGQCLLSSMIGGRSGNRGLCAQPCRLPYELLTEDGKRLDKGYLLSPRDNLGIEYLPELIKSGVDSFKIEGRMKTPTYVGTVTKIYRKYIDFVIQNINLENSVLREKIQKMLNEKNEKTALSDKEELTQVFNRGGFETGHFSPSPNKKLIYKEKPNNMGIYLGTVMSFNENKGHIKLKLEDSISVGDKISINNESYTVSELMIDNKNFEKKNKGEIVKIGRMKGDIRIGAKIYRIESSLLNKNIYPTFKEDKNFRKVKLNAKMNVLSSSPITLKVWSNEGFYRGLECEIVSDIIPDIAVNRPITKEDIIKQLSKTGATEFEFENIEVNLENGLFIPKMSMLNDLRRNALEKLENLVLEKFTHKLNFEKIEKDLKTLSNSENQDIEMLNVKNFDMTRITDNLYQNLNDTKDYLSKNKISILFNNIDLKFDYTKLQKIDRVYIPYKFFVNNKYSECIKDISSKFKIYVVMPYIMQDSMYKKDRLINNLKKIIENYNVNGFVISNICQIEILKDFNLELIGNYNLNIYNNFTVAELNKLGIQRITFSPELERKEIDEIVENNVTDSEILVYGKIQVMTNRYCYLGCSNKCYKGCDRKCDLDKKYYLKDRKDLKFLILPDNTCTVTSIFNSKITSIKLENEKIKNLRIDITDESVNDIQNIIDTVSKMERFEGKNFTNGKF